MIVRCLSLSVFKQLLQMVSPSNKPLGGNPSKLHRNWCPLFKDLKKKKISKMAMERNHFKNLYKKLLAKFNYDNLAQVVPLVILYEDCSKLF